MRTIIALGMAFLSSWCILGCSLGLTWNIDDCPCSTDKRCLPGYTCLGSECIKNHSQVSGGSCNDTIECKVGLVCPTKMGIYYCQQQCQSYFALDMSCASGLDAYCLPVVGIDGSSFSGQSACIDSRCSTDADCQTKPTGDKNITEVCIKFTSNSGNCYHSCNYSVRQDQGYWVYTYTIYNSGDPAKALNNNQMCHPIGPTGNTKMAIWPFGTRTIGEECDVATDPCARDLVCLQSTGGHYRCHALCQVNDGATDGCDNDAICVPETNFSYCALPQ